MKLVNLVIVEDHPLVRRGIRGLLQAQPDFRVVGEASNGLEALHVIEQTRPDVVITDIVMPMVDGLDLLRELSAQVPRPTLVVLSLYDDPRYIAQATQHGAAAYVLKQSAPMFLVTAVRDALAGRFFCTPAVSTSALAEIEDRLRRQLQPRLDLLNEDERLVLQLLAADCAAEEIKLRLAHQPLEVTLVCRNITLKLGLGEAADLRGFAKEWRAGQPR